MLGVLKATRTNNDDQAAWKFWLERCVRWGIRLRLRELKRKGFYSQELPLDSDTPGVTIKDDAPEQFDFTDLMDRGLGCLTTQQQSVIRSVYMKGLTITEAGKVLGLTQGRASQIHHDALAKLKEFFGEYRAA